MNFDDIRPYNDEEVHEKIKALVEEPQFQQVMEQVSPEVPFAVLKAGMLRIRSIRDFQAKIIVPMLEKLCKQSTQGVTCEGLENLEPGKSYCFVSTHRDIALDSALMNLMLFKADFDTAEIAIGDNLMKIPWVVDLVKLNKTFIVKRSLPKEQRSEGSLQLSSYINYAVNEKGQSVWIAQKAGRSKDGNDRTNPSIIKMFSLAAGDQKPIDYLKTLNICPVSIAYEYNPCDVLTMPELMAQAHGESYVKAPMEDLMQMGEGITGRKGKVKVSFGKPLNNSLEELRGWKTPNELYASIARQIDNQIHATYGLMDTHYLAYDLLHESNRFEAKYTLEEKQSFENYVTERTANIEGEPAFVREVFLKMYATPVVNRLALEEA